jgi:hypothetical protein
MCFGMNPHIFHADPKLGFLFTDPNQGLTKVFPNLCSDLWSEISGIGKKTGIFSNEHRSTLCFYYTPIMDSGKISRSQERPRSTHEIPFFPAPFWQSKLNAEPC